MTIKRTTKTTRKLSLTRETLRALGKEELGQAAGGVSGSPGCNCSLGMCDETRFLCLPTIEVDVQ